MPQLAIILVNYKRAQDTIECVRSIKESSFTDVDLIIVDNASGDGSVGLLREHCPGTTILVNEKNLGFAEGNNLGIRLALRKTCEYILLLNNDTVVEPNMLTTLVGALKNHPEAGAVGAKIYYFDRPRVIWFAGGFFNDNSSFGGHYGIDQEDNGKFDTPMTCDFVTGCCLLFRSVLADQIGLLASSYFAYYEDADFCHRVRQAGYVILYEPRAILHHKVSATSTWDSPVYIYFNLRNKILYLRRNSSAYGWLPYLPRLVYFYLRQFVRLTFKWHDLPGLRAAYLGLRDGISNFTGDHGEGSLDKLTGSTRVKSNEIRLHL